jgi:hypothetical protein
MNLKISKWFNIIKKEGVFKLYLRLQNIFIQSYFLYEIDLTANRQVSYLLCPLNSKLLIQLELENTLEEISPIKLNILNHRLELSKSTDFVFLDNGHITGHYGLAFENLKVNKYINNGLKLAKNTTYLFDDYTKVEYRGCGYHKESIIGRLNISLKKGYNKSVVLIYKNNFTSAVSYEKVGFVKKCSVYEIKLFGKSIMIGAR